MYLELKVIAVAAALRPISMIIYLVKGIKRVCKLN